MKQYLPIMHTTRTRSQSWTARKPMVVLAADCVSAQPAARELLSD